MPWTGSSLDQVLSLTCTRTKDEAAKMAGNPLSRNASIFAPWALQRHDTSASIRSKFLKAEDYTLRLTGSSLDQVLILPCTRT